MDKRMLRGSNVLRSFGALTALVVVASALACSRDTGKTEVAPAPSGKQATRTEDARADRVDPMHELTEHVAAAARAAGENPKPAEPAPSPDEKNAKYLGTFNSESVRAAAQAAAGTKDQARAWRMAEWKSRPNTVVALSFQSVPFGAKVATMEPRLSVLEAQNGKLTEIARGRPAFTETHCENAGNAPATDDEAPTLALDLAPYAIAKGKTALGVRLQCHNSFPAGDGVETRLALFEIAENSILRKIFEASVDWDNHDRVGGDSNTEGIVIVQKTAHAGYFDLLLQTTVTRDSDPPEKRTEKRLYVWSGDRYAEKP